MAWLIPNDPYKNDFYNNNLDLRLLFFLCNAKKDFNGMGGDEFSLLLLNCTNQQALDISERIRNCVEKHDFKILEDKFLKFTVSIGVSTYLETIYYPEQFIQQADTALYKAKYAGKNKVCSIMTSKQIPHFRQ